MPFTDMIMQSFLSKQIKSVRYDIIVFMIFCSISHLGVAIFIMCAIRLLFFDKYYTVSLHPNGKLPVIYRGG